MQWRDVYRDGMIKIFQMQRLLKVVTKKDQRVLKHLLKLYDNDEDMAFTNQFSQPMISIFADLIQ
jgi:hypothetical protein